MSTALLDLYKQELGIYKRLLGVLLLIYPVYEAIRRTSAQCQLKKDLLLCYFEQVSCNRHQANDARPRYQQGFQDVALL